MKADSITDAIPHFLTSLRRTAINSDLFWCLISFFFSIGFGVSGSCVNEIKPTECVKWTQNFRFLHEENPVLLSFNMILKHLLSFYPEILFSWQWCTHHLTFIPSILHHQSSLFLLLQILMNSDPCHMFSRTHTWKILPSFFTFLILLTISSS